jgi:hypothetical protein
MPLARGAPRGGEGQGLRSSRWNRWGELVDWARSASISALTLIEEQLALTPTGADTATIAGPPNPETAPPGYYMLFLVDAARTPSVAAIVRVY